MTAQPCFPDFPDKLFPFFKQFAGRHVLCYPRSLAHLVIAAEKDSPLFAKAVTSACIDVASGIFYQKAAFTANLLLHILYKKRKTNTRQSVVTV